MEDAIEPAGRLRDLVRGRITGRLAWRKAIAASGLPAPARDLIERVVRRTRLWRLEKAGVVAELVAHFADGIAAGASVDELVRDFGDERAAARLIRLAKRRNRPLAWHALKWTRRGLAALALLYACVFARFVLTKPTVRVDYVAQLNAPTLAAPEADRAWPIYRRAILALGLADLKRWDASIGRQLESDDPDAYYHRVIDAKPGDAAWPELAAWLDANADGIALARVAAAKPTFGFVYGPDGSQKDAALGWHRYLVGNTSIERSLRYTLLPHLNLTLTVGAALAADVRLAASRGDAARAAADVDALLGLARQLRGPTLVEQTVGLGIADLAFDELEAILATRPAAMDDATLVVLAHRIATFGGEAPASLVDPSAERAMFRDVVQRLYSDDGRGDGILTMEGVRALPFINGIYGLGTIKPRELDRADFAAATAVLSTVSAVTSRRAVVDEFDRLFNLSAAQFARPRREWTNDGAVTARLNEIHASPILTARYLPVSTFLPSIDGVGTRAERLLGRRDGIVVGLALELCRRRQGEYPASLDLLVPNLLPRVPADRINGLPLCYRVIDGRPVVYSVGYDRHDDGGRAAIVGTSGPVPTAAARWGAGKTTLDGDWIVYDARPAPAAAVP